MKRSVDHNARKRQIIQQSIRLFAELGYKNVSFREISERCGIARTVLYRYFRDKRQIFDLGIAYMMDDFMQRNAAIFRSRLPSAVRLRQLCTMLMTTLFDNRELLGVILDFLLGLKHRGFDPAPRVRMFTRNFRRLLHMLIVRGVHRGEFRKDVDVDLYTDLIYAQYESVFIRLTVSGDAVRADLVARMDELLKGLETK